MLKPGPSLLRLTKNVSYASGTQVHSRPQSNDRSTTDAAAGHLRTNGHLYQQQQGRSVNQTAQHNLFSWMGGCCRCTCKPSARNLSRIHDLFVKFSSSLCEFLSQDGSLGHGVGGAAVGGAVALHVRSRIIQMRVTAQARNDASRYGPDCELFFLLMKREPQ